MRVEKIQGNKERSILISMITNATVLGRISTKWKSDKMFHSKWANIVGTWCVSFYKKYGTAPNKQIQGLYETWAIKNKDEDLVKAVEKFLSNLSSEFETTDEGNPDVVIDEAAEYFTKVAIQRTIELSQGYLDKGMLSESISVVQEFGKVELGTGESIDILTNNTALKSAFSEEQVDLIEMPGALGSFFKGQLYREALVAFMAPEKRGKTFWLMELGWQAMLQRRRVLWVSAGDMSEKQMLRRLAIRASGIPLISKKWPCTLQIPTKIRKANGEVQIKTKDKVFEKPLSYSVAQKALDSVYQDKVKGKDFFRLATYPNSSLGVRSLDQLVVQYAREGWVADVVIIDYADILDDDASISGNTDARHKVNATWKLLRRLSGERHVLVITATQTDANSYTQEIITRSNFSEDKRKFAHVTGMCAINQTNLEKAKGIFRLNWVLLREGYFSETECVAVAGNLAIGRPALVSTF